MPKVITSQGITDFVQSGKHEVMKPDKAKPSEGAPALEVVKTQAPADIGGSDKPEVKGKPEPKAETKTEEKAEAKAEADDDETPVLSEDSRKYVNKQHRLRKEAQEAAAEAERFAENQYNARRLAEERAERLDRELSEARTKTAKPEPELTKPDPQKFYDDKGQFKAFEYAEALSAYSATKAVAEDRAKQVEAAKAAAAAEAEQAAMSRVAKARSAHDDYDEVIRGTGVKTHPQVLQYMTGSEHIGEVAYYLAKHPDYVERINKLNPLKAIAEIGKLELTFEKPRATEEEVAPVPKVSGAPAPIKPLQPTGAGMIQTDPSKMSFKELREYERNRAKRR